MRTRGVSVILPTAAAAARAGTLRRAIRSVLMQESVRVQAIVVANGRQGASDVLADLQRRRDIRFVHREDADLPAAIALGRALVDTPYFAEVDDDDELLPSALAVRVAAMEDDCVDVVVSNGYLRIGGRDRLAFSDLGPLRADPLRALFVRNWLVPCATLYRTERVTLDLFEGMPRYLEWTYLALRLALNRTIAFLDVPTFVHDRDREDSLSKSKQYVLGQPAALRRLMRVAAPADVRRRLRRRYGAALHSASDVELADRRYLRAWMWHARSILSPAGWRYLPYTRHLCWPGSRDRALAARLSALRPS